MTETNGARADVTRRALDDDPKEVTVTETLADEPVVRPARRPTHGECREALTNVRAGLDHLERAAVCFALAGGHATRADLPTDGTRIVVDGFVQQLANMREQAITERDTLADAYARALDALEATDPPAAA